MPCSIFNEEPQEPKLRSNEKQPKIFFLALLELSFCFPYLHLVNYLVLKKVQKGHEGSLQGRLFSSAPLPLLQE